MNSVTLNNVRKNSDLEGRIKNFTYQQIISWKSLKTFVVPLSLCYVTVTENNLLYSCQQGIVPNLSDPYLSAILSDGFLKGYPWKYQKPKERKKNWSKDAHQRRVEWNAYTMAMNISEVDVSGSATRVYKVIKFVVWNGTVSNSIKPKI